MNKDLAEKDKVDPIDRKAGHRKERSELLKAFFSSSRDLIAESNEEPQRVKRSP